MDEVSWNVCEYDMAEPVALVEYKARGATVDLSSANNRALRRLADRAGLPCFLVIYDKTLLQFAVKPMNEKAEATEPKKVYTEEQFVRFQHRLRGRA